MRVHQLKKLEPSLESIALSAQMVSIESRTLEGPVGSLESLAVHRPNLQLFRRLGDLVDDVSSFVNNKLAGLRSTPKSLDLGKLMRTLQKENYLDLAAFEVAIPEGMSVPWLQYIGVLEHANNIAMRLYDDTLQPFSLFIGQAINTPSKLSNETFQHGAIIHDLDQVRAALLEVKRNGKRSTARYGDVVNRNADWQEIEDRMNAMMETRKKVPQELVRKTVVELDNQIKLLLKNMGNTNLQYRPTPAVVTQLADLCHALAEQVSYYAIVSTLVIEAQTAIEETQKTMS